MTPGAGGIEYGACAGGGGGILVNEAGPPTCSDHPDSQGKGYGGGAFCTTGCEGLDGVVILDFL